MTGTPTSTWVRPASVLAAIAIVFAVAATRPSPEEPALRSRIAGLRAEVAKLRAAQAAPEPGPVAKEPPASPPPNLEPESPPAKDRLRSLLHSRSRSEQGLGLRQVGLVADRDEKIALLRDLLEGSDASLKSRALSILRGLRGPEAAALAAGVLRKDGPSWLRAQAASVLGEIADPSALPVLLEVARADDLDVRAGAASSLDRLGHSAPLQELIATLAEMLGHRDGGKREDAVSLLSSLQTPSAMPSLVRALGDPTNSRVREAAAEALGRSRLAQAIPPLEAALDDPEPRVREAARQAIDTLSARPQTP